MADKGPFEHHSPTFHNHVKKLHEESMKRALDIIRSSNRPIDRSPKEDKQNGPGPSPK